MATYNCGYPIYHPLQNDNLGNINYQVYVLQGSTRIQIYEGTIAPFSTTDSTVEVDISDICKEYLNTFYENITFTGDIYSFVPSNGNISTVNTFIVTSDEEGSIERSYTVIYNYNTDYIQTDGMYEQQPDTNNINEPIDNKVDPRQRINLGGYNTNTGACTYSWSLNGNVQDSRTITNSNYHLYSIDLSSKPVSKGDIITMTQTGFKPFTYRVTDECPNKYVLYYVNKYGGLDSILCSGRYVESWTPDRVDIETYSNRINRQDFSQRRIHQDIEARYELNTGLIPSKNADRIDNLIYSPKMFLHNLETGTITSCMMSDSSYAVRSRRNRDNVFYTFTVYESKKYIRE